MNQRQRLFADYYLTGETITKAAIKAGYSEKTAYSIGSELKKKPEIAEYIEARSRERWAALGRNAERVLEEQAKCAFYNAADLFDAYGNPKPLNEIPRDTTAAITAVKIMYEGEEGTVVGIELASKEKVLAKLADQLGMNKPPEKAPEQVPEDTLLKQLESAAVSGMSAGDDSGTLRNGES